MSEGNDLHSQLKNLIELCPLHWTYAILWRFSFPHSALSFHDGYCRTIAKPKHLRLLGSPVTAPESVTDAEWFFRVSAAQSFQIDQDLPGHALRRGATAWLSSADSDDPLWERAAWGRQFGIRTLLCVPLKERDVLELASTQIEMERWSPFEVIRIMEDLISPIGVPRLSPIDHHLNPFRNDKKLHERAVNDMQNGWNDNLYNKQSRGKEKISDSKCSWPLLTEMSDRTFSYSHDFSGPS